MMGSEDHPLSLNSDLMESVKLDQPPEAEEEPPEPIDDFSMVHSHPLGRDVDSDEEFADYFSSADRIRNKNKNKQVENGDASSTTEYLSVMVTQPQKQVEAATTSLLPGGNVFVSYLVTTRTNVPEYRGRDFEVRRRFRDVVALADSLVDKYRGYFVPSRPDKGIVDSQFMQKREFIEQRRLDVEKYLQRLAAHPVLRKSEELRTFLVHNGRIPMVPTLDVASRMLDGAAKLPRQLFGDAGFANVRPDEVVRPAKGGRDLLRLFKELKQSVTNEWIAKPSVVEEDKEFIEKRDALRAYEHQLAQVGLQSDLMIKARVQLSLEFGQLGLSILKLSNLELINSSDKAYAKNVSRVAKATVKASRITKAAAVQADGHMDTVRENLAVLQSAQYAFTDRSNALLTVQTLLSDIALMHSKVEKHSAASMKVFGGDKSKNRKIDDLRESIRVTQEACENAQQQYNHIKELNREEIERIEGDKQRSLVAMLQAFARSQVVEAEKLAQEWTQAAEATSGNSRTRSESPLLRSNLSFHG